MTKTNNKRFVGSTIDQSLLRTPQRIEKWSLMHVCGKIYSQLHERLYALGLRWNQSQGSAILGAISSAALLGENLTHISQNMGCGQDMNCSCCQTFRATEVNGHGPKKILAVIVDSNGLQRIDAEFNGDAWDIDLPLQDPTKERDEVLNTDKLCLLTDDQIQGCSLVLLCPTCQEFLRGRWVQIERIAKDGSRIGRRSSCLDEEEDKPGDGTW